MRYKLIFLTLIVLSSLNIKEIIAGGISGNGNNPAFNKRSYNTDYYRLLRAYNSLLRSEWPLPGKLPAMKLNDKKEPVIKLKEYLRATGDLRGRRAYMSAAVYDSRLEKAVKRFQSRYGLKPDGIAGKMTIEEMNVPLSYRLNQMEVNLERLKSVPKYMGDRYIVVNIPAFHMQYYDKGRPRLDMNVVVGDIENYTPVMQDTMRYIVFNPPWNVPESIAIKEILPEVKSDPGYLSRHNYIILKGAYNSTDTINPEEMDWSEVSEDNFPYSIVQKPGKDNALGRIKFMFPNHLNIYLHDTPAGQMFKLEKRDLSHGCIRLEKPVELADILLSGQMDPEGIQDLLDSEETKNIKLDKKVVVYLLYQTAWIDNAGALQFRDDIYEIDSKAVAQLKKQGNK